MRRYNSPKTHRLFLQRLSHVLPAHVRPILITDAGFRGPWFRQVESLGWDWIGRIRNTIKYLNPNTRRWCYVHPLYKQATPRPQHLGWRYLSKRHRYACRLYLVRACAQRMSIEETFRDLKNHRWGFGLRYARTSSTERLEILLLIGALASLALWLTGLAAKSCRWMRHFQANTERRRDVLSTVFLGQQLWRHQRFTLTSTQMHNAFKQLQTLVAQQAKLA